MTERSPFRHFKTSPQIIRLAVTVYVRYPLSLRNVEDLLHGPGIEISDETVRFWWNRFGPMFAPDLRRERVERMRALSHWGRHLGEVSVKINGVTHHLWRDGHLGALLGGNERPLVGMLRCRLTGGSGPRLCGNSGPSSLSLSSLPQNEQKPIQRDERVPLSPVFSWTGPATGVFT